MLGIGTENYKATDTVGIELFLVVAGWWSHSKLEVVRRGVCTSDLAANKLGGLSNKCF